MYKIVGADRREYGPVTKEAVLEWIAQGRANAQTIARFEDGAWKPLGTFDEFKEALNVTAALPPASPGAPPPVTGAPPPAFATSALPVQRETNQTAVWALICSILGFCCCVGSILGIVLGILSLDQIKKNPQRYSTDASLPKIAIGIAIVALLSTCAFSIFGPSAAELQRQIEKALPRR